MNVVLLFGGDSEEYEISLASAACVLPALLSRHTVYPVGIDREGGWYLAAPDPAAIAADHWREGATPVLLDPARHALLADGGVIPADAAFPLLHGGLGEGGGVAATLSLLGLPYVGCPPTAGMLGMDKVLAKRLCESAGIATARFLTVTRADPPDAAASQIAKRLGYPLFVKPATLGSSVGAARVDREEQLLPALTAALALDPTVLCEEYIEGAEVELALLERGGTLFGRLVGEIDPGAAFYDYNAKYRDRTTRIFIPARVPAAERLAILEAGRTLFRLFGCRGLARVDFFVRGEEILFNEINTMPGFTDVSMFPRLLSAAGLPLEEVVDILLENAHL